MVPDIQEPIPTPTPKPSGSGTTKKSKDIHMNIEQAYRNAVNTLRDPRTSKEARSEARITKKETSQELFGLAAEMGDQIKRRAARQKVKEFIEGVSRR